MPLENFSENTEQEDCEKKRTEKKETEESEETERESNSEKEDVRDFFEDWMVSRLDFARYYHHLSKIMTASHLSFSQFHKEISVPPPENIA